MKPIILSAFALAAIAGSTFGAMDEGTIAAGLKSHNRALHIKDGWMLSHIVLAPDGVTTSPARRSRTKGQWWCTAFFNANRPPLSSEGIETRDLSEDAQTINGQGVTLVPLDFHVVAGRGHRPRQRPALRQARP